MSKTLDNAKRHWQDGCNLLLGIWLVASPWALAFTEVKYAPENGYVPGVIIAVAAASAIIAFQEWEEWVNIILGLWVIASPWLFNFAAVVFTAETQAAFAATYNFVITGLLVTGLAAWSTYSTRKHGPLPT